MNHIWKLLPVFSWSYPASHDSFPRGPRHGYLLGPFFSAGHTCEAIFGRVAGLLLWGGRGLAPSFCALWLCESFCICGKSPLSASTQYSSHWWAMMDGTALNRMLWIWPVFSLLLACCWFPKLCAWPVKRRLQAVSKGSGCFSDVWNK